MQKYPEASTEICSDVRKPLTLDKVSRLGSGRFTELSKNVPKSAKNTKVWGHKLMPKIQTARDNEFPPKTHRTTATGFMSKIAKEPGSNNSCQK